MRVRDLIPNAQALLTRRYWRDRAAIVDGRATEYPVREGGPQNIRSSNNGQQQTNSALPSGNNVNGAGGIVDSSGNYVVPNDAIDANGSSSLSPLAAQQAQES